MEKSTLKIFCMGGPHLSTEWASTMGDKYRSHMSFEPVLVESPSDAQIVVWDGLLTPKSRSLINEFMEQISEKTVLLITGEGKTLFTDHPFIRFQDKVNNAVFLPPSRNLPEEILEVLDECRLKATHV